MVRKYEGGQLAPGGIYLHNRTWELTQVPEGDYLPAGEGAYYRLPVLLVLVLGPLVGLAFILFLPFAVPILALHSAFRVIAGNMRGSRRSREVKGGYRGAR